jgi:hypothetical protein
MALLESRELESWTQCMGAKLWCSGIRKYNWKCLLEKQMLIVAAGSGKTMYSYGITCFARIG